MIISPHQHAHSGNFLAGPTGGHHHGPVGGSSSQPGDRIQISMEAQMSVGTGGRQSANPLLAGLQDNFGPQGANQCGRPGQGGARGAEARLRRGLERCQQARSPRQRQAAGTELRNEYQSCKAQQVRLNPGLEVKVLLTLLMMGAGDQQGGQAGGGQQCPGGQGESGDRGGCHKPKDKDKCKDKHHDRDHDHDKGKRCKDKQKAEPNRLREITHGPKGGPARIGGTTRVA